MYLTNPINPKNPSSDDVAPPFVWTGIFGICVIIGMGAKEDSLVRSDK